MAWRSTLWASGSSPQCPRQPANGLRAERAPDEATEYNREYMGWGLSKLRLGYDSPWGRPSLPPTSLWPLGTPLNWLGSFVVSARWKVASSSRHSTSSWRTAG